MGLTWLPPQVNIPGPSNCKGVVLVSPEEWQLCKITVSYVEQCRPMGHSAVMGTACSCTAQCGGQQMQVAVKPSKWG